MEKKIYITAEESKKCRKVADAYAELDDRDILVLDAGRFGFIRLQWFPKNEIFDEAITYVDSVTMFNDLWEDWLGAQLFDLAVGTPMIEMDCEDIFKSLPIEKQEELMAKRLYFAEKAGIEGIEKMAFYEVTYM